jgi:hypothetical protein
MAGNIAVYPWEYKYPTGRIDFRNALNGYERPCNNEIHTGSSSRTEAGYSWEVKNGGYTAGTFNDLFWRGIPGSANAGFRFKAETSTNGLQIRKWFDIGAEGQREDDGFVASGARGTWLRGCTGLWLMTNTYEMKDTRGCSGSVLQMAIRYRNPSNNHMVLKRCTEKLSSGLSYGQSHYHSTDPVVWGYRLSSSDRSTVINNNYQLLGFRIHLQLWREGGGVTTDNLRFGVTALSPSFGNSANTTASKQLIIRKPDTMRSNETNQYNILTY